MLIEPEYALQNFIKGKQAEPLLKVTKFMPKKGTLSVINLSDLLSGHVQEKRKNQEPARKQSSTYKESKILLSKPSLLTGFHAIKDQNFTFLRISCPHQTCKFCF
jgi:hypothetical protein